MTLNEIAEQLKVSAIENGGKLLLDNSIIQTDSWQVVLDTLSPQVLELQLDPENDIYVSDDVLFVKGEGPLYESTATSETQIKGEEEANRICDLTATISNINLSDIPNNNMGLIDNPTLWLPSYSFSNAALSVSSESKILELFVDRSAQTYDILPILKINLEGLGFKVTKYYLTSTLFNYTFSISGSFNLGPTSIPTQVDLPATITSEQNWNLGLGEEGDYLVNLADTFNLLGGVNIFQEMPSALTEVGGFGIIRMSISFFNTASTTTIKNIMVQFGCNDWTLVDGFTIKSAAINISVFQPFEASLRNISTTISGEFHLGTGTPYIFTVSMSLSTGTQDWSLNMTAHIPLDNISAFDALPGGLDVGELNLPNNISSAILSVNQFTITYNPTSKTLGYILLDVSMQAVWYFYQETLGISNPYLYLRIDNPINSNRLIDLKAGGNVIVDTTTLLVSTTYSNAPTTWSFAITQDPNSVLSLASLVTEFLPDYDLSNLPDFVPSDIELSGFGIKIFSDPINNTTNYHFQGKTITNWDLTIGNIPVSAIASFNVTYKSNGELSGNLSLQTIISQLDLTVGYEFSNDQKCLYVDWNLFKGSYCTGVSGNFIKIEMGDISFGGILELLVKVVQPSLTSYSLPAPWSILNEISLKGLALKIDVSKTPYDVEVTYTLPKPINLGFLTLDALNFKKPDPATGDTSYVSIELSGSYLGGKPIPSWNSPNQNPPTVPGEGNAYLDLRLLALGQRVSINGFENLNTIKEVIAAMRKIPSSGGSSNPVDGQMQDGYPIFNNDSNWLIATNFGILRVGNEYTFDLSVVFNDPELYGIRIEMAGAKAKIFAGLKFEIMYKKISDSVGMYQMELTLPDIMRYLQFGVVSIILPVVVIQIYTNGDFYFDIGFPHNDDFSRSFTATAIIMGVPFRGSAGFYFGKLSNETATQIPETTSGTFNPVIVFGLGLQIGIGYDIQYGILKAGFSLMLVGIIEGVIAAFSPYEADALVAADADKNQVEGSYYYKVSGTFGIIGKLYGSIDFGIIKADVTINIYALVKGTFEAYREMVLAITVGVEAQASAKINLGIFSIKVSFSFSMTIEQEYTLGSNNEISAPWYSADTGATEFLAKGRSNGQVQRSRIRRPRRNSLHRKMLRNELRRQIAANRNNLESYRKMAVNTPWESMVNRLADNVDQSFNWTPFTVDTKDLISVWLMPGLTVSGSETGDLTAQRADYIATLYTDAPSQEEGAEKSSFDYLVENVFRWVINSWINDDPGAVSRTELNGEAVSLDDLQDAYDALTETEDIDPISYADIKVFLQQLFNINISTGETEELEGALFAMIPELQLSVPEYNGEAPINRDFYTYSQCGEIYQTELRAYFDQLEVQVEEEMDRNEAAKMKVEDETQESLATFIFEDYFLLIAKQLLQDSLDVMNAFTYALADGDSLESILTWMNNIGRNGQSNTVTIAELIETSRTHLLAASGASSPLLISGVQYGILENQSLLNIAYDTGMDLAYLSEFNALNPNILLPDAQIELNEKIYIVPATGGTLQDAADFFSMTVSEMVTKDEEKVGRDKALLQMDNFLLLAACDYQVLSGDSLTSISSNYPIDPVVLVEQNQAEAGLLVPGSVITYGGKEDVVVSTDTFQTIAKKFEISVAELGADPDLQNQTDLLVPLAVIMIPAFEYIVQSGDTLQSLADLYSITAEALGNNFQNVSITNIFDRSADNELLNLPPLEFLEVENILTELVKGGKIFSLAGMSSRYALHGLRLPITSDITFPDGAPGPEGSDCAVYKMTGQQWQLPNEFVAGSPYTFEIIKPEDLDWITFNNGSETTLLIEVDEVNGIPLINEVRDYAQSVGVQPLVLSLEIMPFAETQAANYTFKSYMEWQSASPVSLPYGSLGDQAIATPFIWNFPSNLENLLSPTKILSPKFGIQIGRSTEGSATMETRSASYYGWGTLVPVQIKKLAQQASDDGEFLNYELLGTNEVSIALLEELLKVLRPGDQLLDQMQILYPPNATGDKPSGIKSDGLENFISFITQSNLSTDTNPPGGGPMFKAAIEETQTLSNGILNDPYDFVRLLWQASITRNGGYSLYYEVVASQTGFPDEIFNEDDVATLYLLMVYNNPGTEELDNLLAPYMNCALTGETIDTSKEAVFAEAMEQKIDYSATGEENLAEIAALYYTNAMEIAAYNADTVLNLDQDVALTMSSIVYELRPEVNSPGNALADILNYFDVSEEELQNANPGVDLSQLATWQILRIPPVTYPLITGGFAGTKLVEIAEYYFITLDSLAYENRFVSKLFAKDTILTINNQILNKVEIIPQGNVGFNMVVENPGEPEEVFDRELMQLDTQRLADTEYANTYLRSLYTLLSYQVVGNVDFSESIMGLPVGPTDESEEGTSPESDPPFHYQKVVPINTYAKFNNISEQSGFPPALKNPYAGIGGISQLHLDWRDLYGNVTQTPLSNPDMATAQPLNNPPAAIGYTDMLLSIAQWPSVMTDYWFEKPEGTDRPKLSLNFYFDPSRYEMEDEGSEDRLVDTELTKGQQNALDDLKAYTTLYYQIHQKDTSDNYLLQVYLTNTLLNTPETKLSSDQFQQILNFVDSIYQYLVLASQQKTANTVANFSLEQSIDPDNDIPTYDLIKLQVGLTFERPISLVETSFKEQEEVIRSVNSINPKTELKEGGEGEDEETLNMNLFAIKFEEAFLSPDNYLLKVATATSLKLSGSSSNKEVWAVRMGLKADESIHYEIGSEVYFYAPRPLANALKTKAVDTFPYHTGEGINWNNPQRVTFSGVDMDSWGQIALEAIDNFLSPEYAAPAFIVDELSGADYLSTILAAKETLAEAIAGGVTNILDSPTPSTANLEDAIERYKQKLLVELGNAYQVTALIQYDVTTNAKYSNANDALIAPRLYGSPSGSIPDLSGAGETLNHEFSLSNAKIELPDTASRTSSQLSFFFTTRNPKARKSLVLDLTWNASHLEHDIHSVEEIDGYEASTWLTFLLPNDSDSSTYSSPLRKELGNLEIPIVLRAYPTPPSLNRQDYEATDSDSDSETTVKEASLWDYSYQYATDHAAQDKINNIVRFNIVSSTIATKLAETKDLFESLAEFNSVYPAIQSDFIEYLSQLNGKTTIEDEPYLISLAAIRSFAEICSQVAEAWKVWGGYDVGNLSNTNSEMSSDYLFTIAEEPIGVEEELRLIIELPSSESLENYSRISSSALPAVLNENFEIPVVEIKGYIAHLIPNTTSYRYESIENPGEYLNFSTAQNIPDRRLIVQELSILNYQNAWSSVAITRNGNLMSNDAIQTNDAFIYQTPLIKFANKLIPLLDNAKGIDMASILDGTRMQRTLADQLITFFQTLLEDSVLDSQAIKIEVTYTYRLADNAAISAILLPVLLLPINNIPLPGAWEPDGGTCPTAYDADSAFVCKLSAAIQQWFTQNKPSTDQAQFRFDIALFSDLNETQLPLIRLRNVYLKEEDIIW